MPWAPGNVIKEIIDIITDHNCMLWSDTLDNDLKWAWFSMARRFTSLTALLFTIALAPAINSAAQRGIMPLANNRKMTTFVRAIEGFQRNLMAAKDNGGTGNFGGNAPPIWRKPKNAPMAANEFKSLSAQQQKLNEDLVSATNNLSIAPGFRSKERKSGTTNNNSGSNNN